jgi:aldose 1-epimerase
MSVQRSIFGNTPNGSRVSLFTLTNRSGNIVQMIDYGAIIVSVQVPDRNGQKANVNLGYSALDGYLTRHPYFGSTVGRFCNRIAKGKFALDGNTYSLAINNGPNHLHGGIEGFDKLIWDAEEIQQEGADGVRFSLLSPDGQEGYPGNLSITAEYTWSDSNELRIVFQATTDRPTVLNLCNHAYWNLSGAGNGDVLEHQLQLNCDKVLEVDETLIPTGKLMDVAGTAHDFRTSHRIGERIATLPATKGYDHCYVVNGAAGTLRPTAKVTDASSGRVMEVMTTQPGVQLYTGNHLDGDFCQHGGFCLETQHFPDSPNQPNFPSTRLNAGEQFAQTTLHRFSVA